MKVYFWGFRDLPETKVLKNKLSNFFKIVESPRDADVIMVNIYVDFKAPVKFIRRYRNKTLVIFVESVLERFPLRRLPFWKRWILFRNIDAVFKERAKLYIISDDASGGNALADKYGVNYIISPNVPQLPSKPDKIYSRKRLGIPLNGIYVGYVGYPSEEFGFHILEDIYLSGNGMYKLLIHPIGKSSDIDRFISKFKGKVFISESLEDFYGSIDITIFPYFFGNKSTYMITSLALGIPPVSFKAHKTEEIVKNGWNGFVVENFSIEEFSRHVSLLVSDPILRETLSRNCLVNSLTFPSMDEKVSLLVQEIVSVCSS